MRVVGARTHNLKNIDVDIPKNVFVVITGKSGSGKSSLAVDTIFAEGQRQYIESLSLYARQFFDQSSSIDVDRIHGLQPTICINQRRGPANPRSTVGTMTEIHDHLRLLMARVGEIRCHGCNGPVAPQSVEQICEAILGLPENTKAMILAPLVVGRKGRHEKVFEQIRKERLVRVRVDGQLFDIDSVPDLAVRKQHDIAAVTDRIIVRGGIESRLLESVQLATRLSDGLVQVSSLNGDANEWTERLFSTKFACPACGTDVADVEPRIFSFNSPYGACGHCHGLGHVESFDFGRVIPDRSRSIDKGAIVVWQDLPRRQQQQRIELLLPVLDAVKFSTSQPLEKLSEQSWHSLNHSVDAEKPGLLLLLEKEWSTCLDPDEVDRLEQFRGRVVCTHCQGTRLGRSANAVFLANQTISQICAMPLNEAVDFFDSLEMKASERQIADPILRAIGHRLTFLMKVGLHYLALDRPADSLSGGELQRVRLASSIGSGVSGACYVLDEPSVGLHPRDTESLVTAIRDLQLRGNSLIVVEHDEAIIRTADHIIDVGPGAGSAGGHIVAQGTVADIESVDGSVTGDFLSGRKKMGLPDVNSNPISTTDAKKLIAIRGASGFNLKNIDVQIPLGKLVCVSGVSGSGKSTLVHRTLAPAIKRQLGLASIDPEPFNQIDGLENVGRLVEVDQRPISRTPRGCAATYTGLFEDLRRIFAATKLAKQRGYNASRFSFNSKSGWCSACEGHGIRRVSMKFMPDIEVVCDACSGRRFNASTLQIKFRDLNIADVLALSVSQALWEFSSFAGIQRTLQCLEQVGLGYLPLGQPSTTLSGGEAQRIKLARELSKTDLGNTLYLLDEPSTGLHFEDLHNLLSVLRALVENGNTVIVIEHNIELIRSADWVIDLGPEGGEGGGRIVAAGTPVQIASAPHSLTGRWLAR